MKKQKIADKQKTALGILWRTFDFNKSLLAKELGVSRQVVNNWFARGRISAIMAIRAEQHEKVTITKEEMRPDVKEWFGV